MFEFFQKRIDQQYPLLTADDIDPYQVTKEQHESFMKNRSESVIGREDILKKVIFILYIEYTL